MLMTCSEPCGSGRTLARNSRAWSSGLGTKLAAGPFGALVGTPCSRPGSLLIVCVGTSRMPEHVGPFWVVIDDIGHVLLVLGDVDVNFSAVRPPSDPASRRSFRALAAGTLTPHGVDHWLALSGLGLKPLVDLVLVPSSAPR